MGKGGFFGTISLWEFTNLAQALLGHPWLPTIWAQAVLICMVQQSQSSGTPIEDPNLHLSVYLQVYNTLKINEASNDVNCLHLSPFSVRDKARAWLHCLASRSIITWDELNKEPFNVVPTPWSPKMDDNVIVLQWRHTCHEVHDSYDSGWNNVEQDIGRGI